MNTELLERVKKIGALKICDEQGNIIFITTDWTYIATILMVIDPLIAKKVENNEGLITQSLPKGFVIHIEGIPFRLETDAIVSGDKRNFVVAGLMEDR